MQKRKASITTKTVREVIDMIDRGELHHNQSTQRKFIYAGMDAQLDCGKTTAAGYLINSILEKGIVVPPVTFWHNTDTGDLNIHDGKQRILTLYYYIKGQSLGHPISTYRNGKETMFSGLSEEEQEYLLDYDLFILTCEGDSRQEEESFYLLNTTSVNLTNYETVAGVQHGQFLRGFEDYVDKQSKLLDKVKPIGRGEQAYKLALTAFDISAAKKAMSNDRSLLTLRNELRKVRNNQFDPKAYRLNEILPTFNELLRGVPGLKEDRALAVANYVVKSGYDADKVVYYYRSCMRKANDIPSWDVVTHKTFIDAYILDGLELDPQRYFTKDVKDALYARSPRCSHIGDNGECCDETSYSKLETDHKIPWSKGGRTTIDNARLLCKSHNASKGNREDF